MASYNNSGKSNFLILQLCNFLETLELPVNDSEEKLRDLLNYPKVYFFTTSVSKQDVLDFSHIIKKPYLLDKINHFVEFHHQISMDYLSTFNMRADSLVLFEDIRVGTQFQETLEVINFFRQYRCCVLVSSQPQEKEKLPV